MVLKKLIFNSLYIGGVWLILKEMIFNSFSTMGGCHGCYERAHFNTFYF